MALPDAMAEMIPDTLPASSTAGEKRVFATLARLPDDCLIGMGLSVALLTTPSRLCRSTTSPQDCLPVIEQPLPLTVFRVRSSP
jgi:hypothetical protein